MRLGAFDSAERFSESLCSAQDDSAFGMTLISRSL